MAGGVFWYGFEKELAQLSSAGNLYSVEGPWFGIPDLVTLQTTATGPKGDLAAYPNLFPLANMISQPLLTAVRRAHLVDHVDVRLALESRPRSGRSRRR